VIGVVVAAAILAPPTIPPPPVITPGMSCYDAGAKLRKYRQFLPEGIEPPRGPIYGCYGGKVVSVTPVNPNVPEFDAGFVIGPGAEPERCRIVQQQVKNDQDVYLERLRGGRRPPAIWLVERKVAGCGVPTPMGYHPTYVLPGAADKAPRR
jgi:hypothetical protein